jgi:large subunit ribosomal protein L18
MNSAKVKIKRYERRKRRIKKKLSLANNGRQRLCISKSNRSIYVQILDDVKQVTVVGLSTLDKSFSSLKNLANIEAAKALGKQIAEVAKQKGITKVVFDRNGYLYHGKIKAFADSARENGLEF